MKYDPFDLVKLVIIFATSLLLYFSMKELRVALIGSQASAESVPCSTPTSLPSATPTPSPEPSPSPTASPVPHGTIYLTEFMACPTSGNEWIELYNASSTEIIVVNWHVIDQSNNKKFFSGSIAPQSFATFEWSGSLLNNTGDSFRVLDTTGTEIGSASYSECSMGISFTYENGEWVGSLESAGDVSSVTENTIAASSSTRASSRSTPLQLNGSDEPLAQVEASTIPTPSPKPSVDYSNFRFPTLFTSFTARSQVSTDPDPIADSSTELPLAPTISVIIGGVLQLLPGGIFLYDHFKSHA